VANATATLWYGTQVKTGEAGKKEAGKGEKADKEP
jgi:hypothetical protein